MLTLVRSLIILAATIIPRVLFADALCASTIEIGYYNGVNSTFYDAKKSIDELRRDISSSSSGAPIVYNIYLNTSVGFFSDLLEAFHQRQYELNGLLAKRYELYWQALTAPDLDWQKVRKVGSAELSVFTGFVQDTVNAAIWSTLLATGARPSPTGQDLSQQIAQAQAAINKGSRLLFVAHSQGNLFANAVYDAVIKTTTPDALKVVHVAPASPTLRGPYVTSDRDWIIAYALRYGSIGAVPSPNVAMGCVPAASSCNPDDLSGHAFLATYMNDLLQAKPVILADIQAALDTMKDPPLPAGYEYRHIDLYTVGPTAPAAWPVPPTVIADAPAQWQGMGEPYLSTTTALMFGLDPLSVATQGGVRASGYALPAKRGLPVGPTGQERWCGTRTVSTWDGSADAQRYPVAQPDYSANDASFNPPPYTLADGSTPASLWSPPNLPPLGFGYAPLSGVDAIARVVADAAARRSMFSPAALQTVVSIGPYRRERDLRVVHGIWAIPSVAPTVLYQGRQTGVQMRVDQVVRVAP